MSKRGSLDSSPTVGYLGPVNGARGGFSFAGRGGVVGGYSYGWPSGGTSEASVAAQWLFDEVAGNIVDEVTGVTLTKIGGPTYSQSSPESLWDNLAPGIYCPRFGADGFGAAGNEANLDIGANHFTIEWWFSFQNTNAVPGVITDTRLSTATNKGYYIASDHNSGTMTVVLQATDGTQVSKVFLTGSTFKSTNRKFRLVGTRGGNLELFMDGNSQGTAAIGALDGKDIDTNNAYIMIRLDSAVATECAGTCYEWRLSLNATNNSGGPNGG